MRRKDLHCLVGGWVLQFFFEGAYGLDMSLQANLSLNKLCLFCILQLSLYDQSLRAISDTLHGFFDEPSQASTMDWSLWANQTKYIL